MSSTRPSSLLLTDDLKIFPVARQRLESLEVLGLHRECGNNLFLIAAMISIVGTH